MLPKEQMYQNNCFTCIKQSWLFKSKTIDNVYKAIEELNYQPNVVARQLFQKKTNIVGLLFPTVANPF